LKVPKGLKNALHHTPVVKYGGGKGQKEIVLPKMAGSGFGFVSTAKEKELLMLSK